MKQEKEVPAVFEKVKADYLEPSIRAPYQLYRFDSTLSGHADRFYFLFRGDAATSFISLTSLINHTLAKGYGYYRWVAQLGEKAEEVREDRAVFGSALHGEALRPIITGGGYDWDWLKERGTYTKRNADGTSEVRQSSWTNFQSLFPADYREKSSSWYYAFTRSLASFFQFAKERIVKVVAVEIPLCSLKWRFAGTLDLVVIIKWNGKERLALIDLKSFFFTLFSEKESKVYYDSHILQLELQLELWYENFGKKKGRDKGVIYQDKEYGKFKYEDALLFNWSPKNWRGMGKNKEKIAPTYDLTNQTDNKYKRLIRVGKQEVRGWELHLYQSKLHDLPTPPTSTIDIVGAFDHWQEFNYEKHILEIDL